MRGVGEGVLMMVMMVVVLAPLLPPTAAFSFPDTLPPIPDAPPPPPSTAGVMTEPPPPRPSELRMRPKECPLYVLGELRAIKKHGETWLNDGSACELCKCVEGVKRCYYHYCNVGTEVVTNPPAGRPPLDDEDGGDWGEEGEEGSGRPPPPPPHYDDDLKGFRKGLGDLRTKSGDNDTRPPGFCGHYCYKACPWGFKMHPLRHCRQCACRPRCPSVAKCPLRCPEGLAKDSQGCHVCQCRGEPLGERKADPECKENGVRGCLDGTRTRQVGDVWARGSCVSCRCVADGYTECNVTHCPAPAPPCPPNRPPPHPHHPCCPPCQESSSSAGVEGEVSVGHAEVSVESAWERQVTYAQPRKPASPGAATGDGAVKSAMQATGVQWWQVWVVTVPLAVLCVLAGVCGVKHWRRTHQDKYDINAYRPSPLTEKLRPVTTAEDRHLKTPIM